MMLCFQMLHACSWSDLVPFSSVCPAMIYACVPQSLTRTISMLFHIQPKYDVCVCVCVKLVLKWCISLVVVTTAATASQKRVEEASHFLQEFLGFMFLFLPIVRGHSSDSTGIAQHRLGAEGARGIACTRLDRGLLWGMDLGCRERDHDIVDILKNTGLMIRRVRRRWRRRVVSSGVLGGRHREANGLAAPFLDLYEDFWTVKDRRTALWRYILWDGNLILGDVLNLNETGHGNYVVVRMWWSPRMGVFSWWCGLSYVLGIITWSHSCI